MGFFAAGKSRVRKADQGLRQTNAAAATHLDRYDWWTYLEKIGFTADDLRLRDLMDSTDFGESIRHVSAFAVPWPNMPNPARITKWTTR